MKDNVSHFVFCCGLFIVVLVLSGLSIFYGRFWESLIWIAASFVWGNSLINTAINVYREGDRNE